MLKVPEGTGDPVRDALISRPNGDGKGNDDNGQSAYNKRLQDAWKGVAA